MHFADWRRLRAARSAPLGAPPKLTQETLALAAARLRHLTGLTKPQPDCALRLNRGNYAKSPKVLEIHKNSAISMV